MSASKILKHIVAANDCEVQAKYLLDAYGITSDPVTTYYFFACVFAAMIHDDVRDYGSIHEP
jgi:hypothetical protein